MKGKSRPKMMKGNKPTMKPMPKKSAKDDSPGKGRKGMMKRLAGAEL